MTKQFFYVEITDTCGREANYSWVTRHKVRASTPRGVMRRIGRESWHKVYDDGETQRWDSRSGATRAFVSSWDDAEHGEYRVNVLE